MSERDKYRVSSKGSPHEYSRRLTQAEKEPAKMLEKGTFTEELKDYWDKFWAKQRETDWENPAGGCSLLPT